MHKEDSNQGLLITSIADKLEIQTRKQIRNRTKETTKDDKIKNAYRNCLTV